MNPKPWADSAFDGEQSAIKLRLGEPAERQRIDLRMRPIYKDLTTGGVDYFCLFRNNDMDLEALKANPANALLFVGPLAQVLKDRGIKVVAAAPRGDHTKLNGFHFVSDVVERAAYLSGSKVVHPFEKGRTVTAVKKCPKDCVIIDDIITRGRTMAACLRAIGSPRPVIILLTNH
jgi:hypothetical protein